jgi:hypothetical protein
LKCICWLLIYFRSDWCTAGGTYLIISVLTMVIKLFIVQNFPVIDRFKFIHILVSGLFENVVACIWLRGRYCEQCLCQSAHRIIVGLETCNNMAKARRRLRNWPGMMQLADVKRKGYKKRELHKRKINKCG